MIPDAHMPVRERIALAEELFGHDVVVAWCDRLLRGLAAADDPRWPDISWLGGTIGWPEYWPRVWGARGLLHAGVPEDDVVVLAALDDPAWRVREMALKVIRTHDIADPHGLVERAVEDPNERVRRQAWRTLGVPPPR